MAEKASWDPAKGRKLLDLEWKKKPARLLLTTFASCNTSYLFYASIYKIFTKS
jgi:hypothetical protein